MPIKLSQYREATRPVAIPVGSDTLTVHYKFGLFTARFQQEMEGDKNATVRALVTLLADWDLLGDDGQPLAITEDILEDVGYALLNQIFKALLDDLVPNAPSGDGSSNTSPDTPLTVPTTTN